MFEHWYVVDPGAHSIRFMDFKSEEKLSLRTCIAYEKEEVKALSEDAFPYMYQASRRIRVKYPLDYMYLKSDIKPLLKEGLTKIVSEQRIFRPAICLIVPTEISTEQQEKWKQELIDAGYPRIQLVSVMELLASQDSAIIVHMGHSYTEIGVFQGGELKCLKTERIGGKLINEKIQRIVAEKSQCLISEEDAEKLKLETSLLAFQNKHQTITCSGYNRYQKVVPVEIDSNDCLTAIELVSKQIALALKTVYDEFEIKDPVKVKISGGLINCFGMQQAIEQALGFSVYCEANPSWTLIESSKRWK